MKILNRICILFVFCTVTVSIYPNYSIAGIDLPWSTTYDCADWTQSNGSISCDGLEKYGDWKCNGSEEQVMAEANNYSGGGGKGQRHWEGDGININSGSLRVEFNSVQNELWIRWYMRYERGFKWNSLNYDKILYIRTPGFSSNGYIAVIPEWYGASFNLASQGPSINYHSNGNGWEDVMGGTTSDGQWHCYEVHLKMDTNGNNGIGEAWIDGNQIISLNNCDFGTQPGWSDFTIGSNQRDPDNGGCMYVDFDDIAVSNSAYIGPIPTGGSDTVAPVVSVTSPAAGASISGNVSASAAASDNVGVVGVQFKIDGANIGSEDTTAPYAVNLDTTAYSDGAHSLSATARDAAGNQTTSGAVSVTVANGGGADTAAPVVSVTSPVSGDSIAGTVAVSAAASDNVGVVGVQFKIDGSNIGSENTTAPYAVNLDTTAFSDGAHSLTATARDAAGNQTTSSAVSVTVANGNTTGGTVLFEESFDDTSFSARGWYDNTSLQLSTVEHVTGSASSVEFHFPQGATTPTSGGAIRKKISDTDEIYVSYYVKYSANWEGSNRSYHPHEFYVLTNLDSDWSNLAFTHLTAYIEQNEGEPLFAIQDGVNIDQSQIGVDLTNVTENRGVAGCNGDSDGYGSGICYQSGSVYVNGKSWRAGNNYFQDTAGQYYKNDWHFVEAYIKLNSISNGKAVADGILRYWYDGQLIINHSNVVIRTGQYPEMRFNQFVIAPYIGDGSPVDQSFWVDNLTVATSRPNTAESLSAPTNLRVQ